MDFAEIFDWWTYHDDQRLGSISTNTPSMILHLDTIRNSMTYEMLAKSDKYLTRETFLDCLVLVLGFIASC